MSDFADAYGIRLLREDVPWVEFRTLLIGLLSSDSRIWRHFHEDERERPEGDEGD